MRFLFLLLVLVPRSRSQSQEPPPTSNGYRCSSDRSIYPCQAYAFYRAGSESGPYPPLLDLPSIGDVYGLSRLTIARASNLTANSSLTPNQPLLIPLTCACSSNLSYAPAPYQINSLDTFYTVSAYKYGNLTSYPAVETVNPTLTPTNLSVGANAVFPIFCQCPNRSSSKNILITYTFQPNDTFSALAAQFGTDVQSLVSINGAERHVTPYLTILIPVSKVPPPVILNHAKSPPSPSPSPPPSAIITVEKNDNGGVVMGLAIGLGLMGLLWAILLMGLVWGWRKGYFGKRKGNLEEQGIGKYNERRKFGRSLSDEKLMTDISEWLDKYKVYRMEELVEATAGFDRSRVIQGSVYRGVMDGEVYAIKKMKWNARDELKILQKVITLINFVYLFLYFPDESFL